MALTQNQNPMPACPEDILDQTGTAACWRVAHTKSRREKSLTAFLAQRGIGYYLPMIKSRQPSRSRMRFSHLPLFPGYVFFRGTSQERLTAYSSGHIARVLDTRDQHQLALELRQIQTVLSLDVPVYPFDFIAAGQKVRIICGPLQGIEGIVVQKKKNFRLVLQVDSIAQAMALDLAADMVEAA